MYKKYGNKKRILSILLITAIFATLLGMCAYAVTYSVGFSFNTGSSGNAYVDGSANGKYYSLSKGTATLRLTDSAGCYSGGSYSVTLYRKNWTGISTKHGTLTASTTGSGTYHSQTFNIPSDSDKYYLLAKGQGYFCTYAATGTLTQ